MEKVIRKVNIMSKEADYGSLQVLLVEVDEDLPGLGLGLGLDNPNPSTTSCEA